MANKPERIIIDTNIFISYLLKPTFYRLDKLIQSKKVVLLFSEQLLLEFSEVVNRPKLKKYFSENDVKDLLRSIDSYAEFIKVNSKVNICRDEKDNFLLA